MRFILDENYPHVLPCMDCVYWRYLYGGARYKGKPILDDSFRVPACHYNIDNDELRGCPAGKGCKCFKKYVESEELNEE